MTSTTRRGVAGRTAVPGGALAPMAIIALVPICLTGCLVQPQLPTPLGPTVQVSSVDGGQAVTPTDPSGRGPLELHYDHNGELGLGLTVTVDPGRPVVLTGARLDATQPMWATTVSATVGGRPLPAALAGGEHTVINLRVRANTCSPDVEREAATIPALVVDLVNAGRRETWRVPMDRPLVVRGPVIVGCNG